MRAHKVLFNATVARVLVSASAVTALVTLVGAGHKFQ